MPTIDDSSKSVIKDQFKSSGYKIWAATVAKVYSSPSRRPGWELLTKAGALLFLRNDQNIIYLRLVDIDGKPAKGSNVDVIWEHELYMGFELAKLEPFFYAFESDDCIYGLMFADIKEAADFSKNVMKRIDKIGRGSSVAADSDTRSVTSFGSAKTNGSSGGGLFKSIFGRSRHSGDQSPPPADEPKPAKKKSSLGKISETDIGDPTGFKHLSHIGFNPVTGAFDIKNIPPQWKKFFEAAGATQADLENKETAAFIAKFVEDAEKKKKGPPPPPPPKSRKAPPPPPPKRKESVASSQPSSSPIKAARPSASKAPPAPPFEDYLAFLEERKAAAAAKEAEEASRPSTPRRPAAPPGPSLNDQLMSSIRQVSLSGLRHVEAPDPSESVSPSPSSAPDGDMAGLLAQALKQRHRVMAQSESEDDDDDWS